MYLLTAIFNSSCFNDVLTDLREKEIEGITISNVIGKGGLGFINESGETDLDKKIRIDIVLSNDTFKELAKEAIRANTRETGTGR